MDRFMEMFHIGDLENTQINSVLDKFTRKENNVLRKPININYGDCLKILEKDIIEKQDTYALMLYRKISDQNWKYRQIFGLCFIVGATDIYDIGCGIDLQVGYIMDYKGMSYTGIDSISEIYSGFSLGISNCIREITENKKKFYIEEYNRLFMNFDSNIHFISGEYPLQIDNIKKNNIAICVGFNIYDVEKFFTALSYDFSRIYFQIKKEQMEIVERLLSDFKIYNMIDGDSKYILAYATKYGDDIQYLNEINYDPNNVKFYIGDSRFPTYIERYLNNII